MTDISVPRELLESLLDADMGMQAPEYTPARMASAIRYDMAIERIRALLAAPPADGATRLGVVLDTKGSRKALGAMNAKLRAKAGRLDREVAALHAERDQNEELRTSLERSNELLWKAALLIRSSKYKINGGSLICGRIDDHLSDQSKP